MLKQLDMSIASNLHLTLNKNQFKNHLRLKCKIKMAMLLKENIEKILTLG